MIILKTLLRTKTGTQNSKNLRSIDQCPAIVYGKNYPSLPISFLYKKEFNLQNIRFLKNSNITLIINDDEIKVKIQEIQYHPFKPKIIHIDFIRI